MIEVQHKHDFEPIRGLPGKLPEGERILWQGAPAWRPLARRLLVTRWVAAYFAGLAAYGGLTARDPTGVVLPALCGLVVLALLYGYARAVSGSTVYTLTNRRVVLRTGIAITTAVNVPLKAITRADLALGAGGAGDLALALDTTAELPINYALLWPHVRPWEMRRPVPVLRMVPDAADVGAVFARALVAAHPGGRIGLVSNNEPADAPAHAVAA